MKEYHKIQTIYKRDMQNKGRIITGEYSCPEFEYLKNNIWVFTEKVDGTNIRIHWRRNEGIKIGGKTDNAQIPVFLYDKLNSHFNDELFENTITKTDELTLYGEGYGSKIQKGGGNYINNGVDFVLFDVNVAGWWLQRENVEEIAADLSIKVVPVIGEGTLQDAIDLAKSGFNSQWGNFSAEGIVLRPKTELFNRNNQRIITKIKHKDFDNAKETKEKNEKHVD